MSIALTFFIVFIGTLLLASLIGLMLYKRILPEYRPMLFLIWTIFVFEVFQSMFNQWPEATRFASRIEIVVELILIAWQAKRWKVFDRQPWMFWAIIIVGFSCWIAEFAFFPHEDKLSWSRIACSFMIVLIAIEILNRTVINSKVPALRDTVFLFSIALIFYFSFSGLLEVYALIMQYSSESMIMKAYYFYICLGILTNIIYLRSLLCLPTKTRYS